MVYINSQKFACASCIKGHRSSSCHHTDRPLFEIKKKGRPVSQCEKCRDLRKNKHMHIKCNCATTTETPDSSSGDVEERSISVKLSPSRRPAQRKLPVIPTLPNGLKDLWPTGPSPPPLNAHPKQRVDALLNPCNCKSVWKCKCANRVKGSSMNTVNSIQRDPISSSSGPLSVESNRDGDAGPADDAFTCCDGQNLSHGTKMPTPSAVAHREYRHLTSMPYIPASLVGASTLTLPTSSLRGTLEHQDNTRTGLDLPPLKFIDVGGQCHENKGPQMLPSFKEVYTPPVETNSVDAVTSLTKCGCGNTCICPGCKEHRGTELAALSGEDCPDGCGSCVDRMGGLALPSPFSVTLPSPTSDSSLRYTHTHVQSPNAGMSTLDHFYAIAALLPLPPPSSRATGPGTLDPTNVSVYARNSGNHGVQKQDWQKAAGLVQVPPLNCCAGRCKCPGGMCGCGVECGGSCGRHSAGSKDVKGKSTGANVEDAGKENGLAKGTGSCCANKKRTSATVSANFGSKNISRL